MKFKFHLYVQKHNNRTYTATVLPFYDINGYGTNLAELKTELAETVKERVQEMPATRLHQFEYDTRLYLQKVMVEVRPMDRKKRNRRREKVKINFSLLVHPQDDGQFFVTVPRLGPNGPSFYVYANTELPEQANIELSAWLDNFTLDQLQEYQISRSETLDTLEVEVPLKKAKERRQNSPERPSLFERSNKEESFWALREIGINMTVQATERQFRRAYRRDDLIDRMMQILLHNRNNSILLTGESESGKTAIIQEVVRRIARKDVPENLQNREVWMLSPDRIIAGAQYIGTWEERVTDLVNECRKKQHILYVSDLPGLLEIGRWSKSDNNVAQALKPYISTGEVIIIGESSPERLSMGERLGPDFMNQFRRIDVPAMSEEETLSVLDHVGRDLEREYDVRVDPSALETSTQLARRFLPYRAFPGKSIRLIEEAVSDLLQKQSRQTLADPEPFSVLQRHSRKQTIRRQDILDTFSRFSGMPEFIINDRTHLDLEQVENYFLERVSGQDHAVSALVNLVAMVKSGLNDPAKPLGTLLFIGPTGVGKTHMAKALASYLFGDEDRLIRFDMSEYSDIDAVARLIGAFNSEGELTKKVRAQPFSVVLLDEFEKASPRIYDIFLQVLGEGRLTDAGGRTTFFHNSIIILTSNLGSSAGSMAGFGFGKESLSHAEVNAVLVEHYRDQIENYFRAEFVNRLDQVIVFGQLNHVALYQIAARELRQILQRDGITRRNLLVEIDDSVIELVLERGYSPQFGARPLKREIEKIVVGPLARQLAQRSADGHSLLRVGVDHESKQISLKMIPIEQAGVPVDIASNLNTTDQRLQVDTAELIEGFAILRRKLGDWHESDLFEQMAAQKAALLAASQLPDFWSQGETAQRKLSRFYFLDRITSRLQELLNRAEYLEDLALVINRQRDLRYQVDLGRDFQELQRDVLYLEIEMQTGHLPHRHQTMLLLHNLGDSVDDTQSLPQSWAGTLAKMYLEWAERKGYDREVYLQTANANDAEADFTHLNAGNYQEMLKRFDATKNISEIALWMEGSNVFGFLKGERGIHQRRGHELREDELAHVRVFAIPDGTNIRQWLKDYQRIKYEIKQGKRPLPPQEKHAIVRLYMLGKAGERFVRDIRTGLRTTRVKDVLEKGQLDEFILALLRQEGSVDWEDRFPPTFPF